MSDNNWSFDEDERQQQWSGYHVWHDRMHQKFHQQRQRKVADVDGRCLEDGFNDRVAQMHAKHKVQRAKLEVLGNKSARILKNYDAESVKTLVHLPASLPN